jgi:hypothetical protein
MYKRESSSADAAPRVPMLSRPAGSQAHTVVPYRSAVLVDRALITEYQTVHRSRKIPLTKHCGLRVATDMYSQVSKGRKRCMVVDPSPCLSLTRFR